MNNVTIKKKYEKWFPVCRSAHFHWMRRPVNNDPSFYQLLQIFGIACNSSFIVFYCFFCSSEKALGVQGMEGAVLSMLIAIKMNCYDSIIDVSIFCQFKKRATKCGLHSIRTRYLYRDSITDMIRILECWWISINWLHIIIRFMMVLFNRLLHNCICRIPPQHRPHHKPVLKVFLKTYLPYVYVYILTKWWTTWVMVTVASIKTSLLSCKQLLVVFIVLFPSQLKQRSGWPNYGWRRILHTRLPDIAFIHGDLECQFSHSVQIQQ